MRIMFVIPTLGTGGAERVAAILANNFCKDNEVEFLVLEKSNIERYTLENEVLIKEIGISVKRGNKVRAVLNYLVSFSKQRKELNKEIALFKPNVVISFLPKADMLTYLAVNRKPFTWIPSERNDPMVRSSFERKMLNTIYKKSDMLVCQTNKVAEYYRQNGVNNICVIRNPIILDNNSIEDPNAPKDYYITVGRLDKQKNYEMLIHAFSKTVTENGIKEKLLILGDGPERDRLQEIIVSHNMEKVILLVGRKKNVNDYLKRAKAFIMSSDYEGLPNAMLEAMALGLPVISTDYFTGAAREFINDDNGIVVSPNDADEMKKAIDSMSCKSDAELETMGRISKEKVSTLNVNVIVNEWKDIFVKGKQQ